MEDIHPIQILKDRLQNRDINFKHRMQILDLFKRMIISFIDGKSVNSHA